MNTPAKPIGQLSIGELHAAAMGCYDSALEVCVADGPDAAIDAFRAALAYEAEAARRLAPRLDFEPTRSVILRSAATMAFRCRDHAEAERWIGIALAGNPHREVADELRDLLEQVHLDQQHVGRVI